MGQLLTPKSAAGGARIPDVLSPDGRLRATFHEEKVLILNARTGEQVTVIPHIRRASFLRFDEGGQRLAVVTDSSVRVYQLNFPAPPRHGDQRLLAEIWTGRRLWAGGARNLTSDEYWSRKRRWMEALSRRPAQEIPPGVATLVPMGLLGTVFLALLPAQLRRRKDGLENEASRARP